jgi:hypothetical protein
MKKIWIYWTLFLLLTVGCIVINRKVFPVPGMLPLEFARSAESMRPHIMQQGLTASESYRLLKMNTVVDYLFLVAYSLLGWYSLLIVLQVFEVRIKKWMYGLIFITGALDAIENIFLLRTGIRQQEAYSWLYAWAVRLKWGAAMVLVLLITVVILYALTRLWKSKGNNQSE